jgi:hypothetical protein
MDKNGNLVISNKPKTSSQRYIILKEELKHEQKALNDASRLLVENSKLGNSKEQQERNKFLNNTINEHQKNIKILNKQLGYAP